MHNQFPVLNPTIFPVEKLTPKLRAAVEEAALSTKAPVALIASTALASASLAVQARFDVKRMKNLKSPCSLYFLTFAESGERKTTIDEMFFRAFREFEKTCKLKATDTDDEIEQDPQDKPQKRLRLLYSDTTPIAYLEGLSKYGCSAGVIEDEAGRIFKSRMVDDIGLLNKLWGGQDLSVDRKSGSFVIRSPRSTINWMVQPWIFKEYMERKGESIRGIGFLARCLVCYPQSTQGWRFIDFDAVELPAIEAFGKRVSDLLNDQLNYFINPDEHTKTELHFSQNAQHEWVNIFNGIEQALQPGGQFCENRDYASKVSEMIARVAGVLHAFEGYDGSEISLGTLRSATGIVLWYANEFLRLFSPPSPMDVHNRNVAMLDNWLLGWARQGGAREIRKNDLLQLAPKPLRLRAVMDMCLATLNQWGRLDYGQAFIQPPTAMTAPPRRPTQFVILRDYYYYQQRV
ncbi:YfjI family protein [Uliginosibacterium sp. sgz301328]|uniref:YfjI family protein n=1 Tax=Uliginosibacterium sp. sgz301328 TaxID=3243764 RepID=UPI00359CE241